MFSAYSAVAHVVAHEPLVAVAQVGVARGGCFLEELALHDLYPRLPLHVGLAREHVDRDRIGRQGRRDHREGEQQG